MSPTITFPETSEELGELISDRKKLGELIEAGEFANVIKAYAGKVAEAKNGDLRKQVDEAVQIGLADFYKDMEAKNGAPVGYSGTYGSRPMTAVQAQVAQDQALYNRRAPGAPLDGDEHSASWGAFARAVWYRNELNPAYMKFREKIQNAMSERVPSEGGYLVPETLRSDLLMLSLEAAIVRPRSRVIPMTSLRLPYPVIDDPTHDGTVYGGVKGSWTEEGGDVSAGASDPTFGRIILEARKLTGYTDIPNELIQDSIDALAQFFRQIYPEALAFFEDKAFLTGSGVGEPQGILNASCAVSVTRATSSEVQLADIAAMYPRMLPHSMNRAVWVISQDVISQLLQLALTVGTTPVAPPLWLGGANGGDVHAAPQLTLLGRPVLVSEKAPKLGDAGDISFVDFGYYLIGDRQSMSVESSVDYKFANDLTSFRVIERVDGRPWLRSALTPANGSTNTLSPVVKLAA